MAQTQNDKPQSVPSKSLMTAGPTLHYSHANVRTFSLVVNVFFLLTCVLWSKLFTDSWFTLSFADHGLSDLWQLGQYVISPISIFEYPWQIAVLGLVMGMMAAVPPLVAQLFSFVYCLPLVFSLAVFAHLPVFAGCVLLSCLLIASRPLRFRSRIVSFALCIVPQMLYWAVFGGSRSADPLMWGFSFAPWISAWLVALFIAGEILLVGHFTRYRPGMISLFSALTLLVALGVFQYKIGFDELAYQRYVVRNNPETVTQFHDHSITQALDDTMANPVTRAYLTKGFYARDPAILRNELKRVIVQELTRGSWPMWLLVPEELDFQAKRAYLAGQYEKYIGNHPKGRRMPIALYYKALLAEQTPDLPLVEEKEILRFHADYPNDASSLVWFTLLTGYPASPESIEARLHLAMRYAGSNNIEYARQLVKEALDMIPVVSQSMGVSKEAKASYLTVFNAPPSTALTPFALADLEFRLKAFGQLIGEQNVIAGDDTSRLRLAEFVMLNPYGADYRSRLAEFGQRLKAADPLADNVALALALQLRDQQERAAALKSITELHPNTDGGIQALYELGRLRVAMWKEMPEKEAEKRLQLLADSRAALTRFVQSYPTSIWAERAKSLLEGLPSIESTEAQLRPVTPAKPN